MKPQSIPQIDLNTALPPAFAVVVIVPCNVATALAEPELARWLSRSQAELHAPNSTQFIRLLTALKMPAPKAALAAMRYWGDTGVQPDHWVAAADPVWMQAGLDKLFLQVPSNGELRPVAMTGLFGDLNRQLFSNSSMQLKVVRNSGYLCGGDGLPTATLPATAIAGEQPNDWIPDGPAAANYLNMTSELQMALHEHPLNRQREEAGLMPVNALWLWGGGDAPSFEPRALPTIYADDPMLRGYGFLSRAAVKDRPENLQRCASSCIVESSAADTLQILRDAAERWRRKDAPSICLLFDDVRCDFRRGIRSFLSRNGPQRLAGVEM